MNKLYTLALLLLGATIFSCKPDEGVPMPAPASCMLASKKYIYPDKSFLETKYSYTTNGHLQKTEEHNSAGKLLSYQEYEFSNNQAVKVITGSANGKSAETHLLYADDKLAKVEHFEKKADQSFGKLYEKTFEYNGDKISRIKYTFFNGGSSFYAIYEYAGNNITAVKAYATANGQLLEEDYYHYDDKPNPYYQRHPVRTGHVQESSQNNVVHSKIVSHRHIPELPEVSYTYHYDTSGKPIKKAVNAPGWGAIAEEQYTYTCN